MVLWTGATGRVLEGGFTLWDLYNVRVRGREPSGQGPSLLSLLPGCSPPTKQQMVTVQGPQPGLTPQLAVPRAADTHTMALLSPAGRVPLGGSSPTASCQPLGCAEQPGAVLGEVQA